MANIYHPSAKRNASARRPLGLLAVAALGSVCIVLVPFWLLPDLRRTSAPPPSSSIAAPVTRLADLLAIPQGQIDRYDIGLLNFLCAEALPEAESLSTPHYLATLDRWAERVRSETDRNLHRYREDPARFENSEAYFRMLIMAAVVCEDLSIHYNSERMDTPETASPAETFFSDSRDIFLHGLCGPSRTGTCSSMPVLYVALGRRLSYPLKLATTKSHLFVRWESPAERFNLEATGIGMNRYDDDHFKRWPFPVTEEEIQADGYLKSLTPPEELALFLSLRGHCLKQAGRTPEAIFAYSEAVRFAPASRPYRVLLAEIQKPAPPAPVAVQSAVLVNFPLPPGAAGGSPNMSAPVAEPNPLLKIRQQ